MVMRIGYANVAALIDGAGRCFKTREGVESWGMNGETIGPRSQGVKEAERHILMLIQRKRRVDLVSGDTQVR